MGKVSLYFLLTWAREVSNSCWHGQWQGESLFLYTCLGVSVMLLLIWAEHSVSLFSLTWVRGVSVMLLLTCRMNVSLFPLTCVRGVCYVTSWHVQSRVGRDGHSEPLFSLFLYTWFRVSVLCYCWLGQSRVGSLLYWDGQSESLFPLIWARGVSVDMSRAERGFPLHG